MKVPGYRIKRLIGKGGSSSVYLAVQESLNRRVALKIMKKFDDPKQAERFVHEGRIIASLNHRNIITIHDVGAFGDRHFIAMEYLEGRSLTERIDEGMALPKVLSLLEQMGACLYFVHKRGIIHRDIKPSNILFHADGTPKLTDFGIAKLLDSDQELTMEGNALGSPYYLSPEQAEGRPLDGRSDLYSLGIVFYQMLTGERPYAERSPVETIVARLTQPLPVLPEQFVAFQALLDAMLAKQPDERIESAKHLVYRIRALKQQLPSATTGNIALPLKPERADQAASLVASTASPSSRRHRWLRAGLPAAMSLAVAAGAAVWMYDDDAPPAPPVALVEATPPDPSTSASDSAAVMSAPAPISTPVSTLAPPAITESTSSSPVVDTRPQGPAQIATIDADAIVADAAATEAETHEPMMPAVADAGVLPETSAGKPQNVDDDTARLMAAGDEALAALRLTRPAGDSALDYYREVLARDPAHRGALDGISAITASYVAMAERALQDDRLDRARQYVRRGATVDADNPSLHAMETSISAREDAIAAERHQAIAAAQPVPEPPPPVEEESLRGKDGTGNIVKDFGRVWRAVFD